MKMTPPPKLLSRDQFREAVFERDKHKCVFCDAPAVDAHHILERRLWPDGGYYTNNGASVCAEHHWLCETTHYSVEQVREACGITHIAVPPHLYADHIYDKWGNPVLEDGSRAKGELFYDASVQKVLAAGDALKLFTNYAKYPRTHHLPWSPGVNSDDRVVTTLQQFEGQRVVVTLKMDGENTTMYTDYIHARSLDSRGGADRAWVKQFWSTIAHDIPAGWRVCGENLWAQHSIHYDDLPSYFMGFSIWNHMNECIDWDSTLEYFELLNIKPVPVLYDGVWTEQAIRKLADRLDPAKDEGYVVRLAGRFSYSDFRTCIAKYVRAGHVQTTKHWRAGRAFTKNGILIGV